MRRQPLPHPLGLFPFGKVSDHGFRRAVLVLLFVSGVVYSYCVPLRTARREIIPAIVEDIEALRPDVDRLDFKGIVLAILQHRWPCREG